MSVSASAVNGSFGCSVFVVVWFSSSSLGSRGSYGFCGSLKVLVFFVVFVVILVILVIRCWVMYCSASLVVCSGSSYDSRDTCGPRDFLVPVMIFLVLRFSWFQCFSWLSWMPWSVLCFLWSESSFCSTRPRCSLWVFLPLL